MGCHGSTALTWVQGASTLVIGAIAVYIAWRQHKTTEDALRMNLFDKYYLVYAAIRDLLSHMVTRANVTEEEVLDFLHRTNEAQFLFGADVTNYAEVLYKKAVSLHTLQTQLQEEHLPVGDERASLAREMSDLLKWAAGQLTPLRVLFYPYLAFRVKTRRFGDKRAPLIR
jgi:hypothetical protein